MANLNQELAQALAEAHKPMLAELERIDRSMRTLACVELARTIYGQDEIRMLLADYQQLVDADNLARTALNRHRLDGRRGGDRLQLRRSRRRIGHYAAPPSLRVLGELVAIAGDLLHSYDHEATTPDGCYAGLIERFARPLRFSSP